MKLLTAGIVADVVHQDNPHHSVPLNTHAYVDQQQCHCLELDTMYYTLSTAACSQHCQAPAAWKAITICEQPNQHH